VAKRVTGGLAAIALALAGAVPRVFADSGSARHLIYLHGRIVQEQQNARPHHARFGYYELEGILAAFRGHGFSVSGGIRPRSATVSDSANLVVEEVRGLLRSGVPAEHVTVVGASMGAGIALLASTRLQNPSVRFCVLGACLSESVRSLFAEEGKRPRGRVLSIREQSDESTANCPSWTKEMESDTPIGARELVLDTGLSHGFLYRPLPEWVNAAVEWAQAR
jgi:pimeloyl-ACP methyl ester carboxylesterase